MGFVSKFVVGLLTVLIGFSFLGWVMSKVGPQPPTVEQKEQTRLADVKRELARNRKHVIENYESQMSAKQFDDAAKGLERYRVTGDQEIARLYTAAREQALLATLAETPKTDISRQASLYGLLAKVVPDNAEYAARQKELAAKAKAAKQAERDRTMAAMRKSHDDVEGITWYHDKSSPGFNNVNALFLYIGEKRGDQWLRLRIQYKAEDWLFVERVVIAADDARYTISEGPWERDHSTEIWEWLDYTPSAADLAMLRQVADAKRVVIRYEGKQYRNDWVLPDTHKQAIKRVLAAYAALGGKGA
jgi:hypothetical protein